MIKDTGLIQSLDYRLPYHTEAPSQPPFLDSLLPDLRALAGPREPDF